MEQKIKEIKQNISTLISSLEGNLDDLYLEKARGYLSYNEIKLTIEMLCDFISEENTILERKTAQNLVEICELLNIKEIYYKTFKV